MSVLASPTLFWSVVTFLFGISVGSFLNVVIYRLPIGGSLIRPEYSYCPNCNTRLQPVDLIPLFSFLALGRRCRTCRKPISWRYFCVELLTGALFVLLYLRFANDVPTCVALLLFTAVLIPIFFIDLATFTINDSLNLAVFLIAIGRDAWGIALREPGHELLWGWLPRSALGAVVGVLIFGAVRVVGWLWKRQEAMGLGDVLLARAMGAMLVSVTPVGESWLQPLRLFPVWVLLATFSGVVMGVGLLALRGRNVPVMTEGGTGQPEPELPADDGSTLGRELYAIGYCLWLGDAIDYVRDKLNRLSGTPEAAAPPLEEDNWQPAPTAIPFGPFLVIGFLLTVFFGEALTAAYLAYALPKG